MARRTIPLPARAAPKVARVNPGNVLAQPGRLDNVRSMSRVGRKGRSMRRKARRSRRA